MSIHGIAFAFKLNTDVFKDVAPEMDVKYPNTPLQVMINATARPTVSFGAQIMNVSVPLELIWSACNASIRDCNAIYDGPGMDEVFRLSSTLRAGIQVHVNNSNQTMDGQVGSGWFFPPCCIVVKMARGARERHP